MNTMDAIKTTGSKVARLWPRFALLAGLALRPSALNALAAALLLPCLVMACGGKSDPAPQKIQVTFIGNGGYPETTTVTVDKGAKVEAPAVTRDGHDFIDWSTDDKPFTLWKNVVKFPAAVSADTTYYAWWCKKDAFNQRFALLDSLFAFNIYTWNNYVVNSNHDPMKDTWLFTDKENAELTPLFKEAYLDGFSRDKYSENLPFGSVAMHRHFSSLSLRFGVNCGGWTSSSIIQSQINYVNDTLKWGVGIHVHEVGHYLGLHEALTGLLGDLSLFDDATLLIVNMPEENSGQNLLYDGFFDYLLLKKVGDKVFWRTIFTSPNPLLAYWKMWDDNMTVMVNENRETLVTAEDFGFVRVLSYPSYFGLKDVHAALERITGRDIQSVCGRMRVAFDSALKNNDAASIEYVRYAAKVAREIVRVYPAAYNRDLIANNISAFQRCM